MKRIIYIITLLLCIPLLMQGAEMTQRQAMDKARTFLQQKLQNGPAQMRRASQHLVMQPVEMAIPSLYAFNAEGGGYVIVSGDDRVEPIIGYSDKGTIDKDKMPCNMRFMLENYDRVIKSVIHNDSSVKAQTRSSYPEAIEPLMKTTWYQSAPFDSLCPKFRGNTSPSGCVCTAMAQVMYYHQWPHEACTEIPAYIFKWPTGETCDMEALPATTFDWNKILLHYDSIAPGTTEQRYEVGKLMRYAGQALCSIYHPLGTAASGEFISLVLRSYFGYSKEICTVFRDDYKNQDWEDLIYQELANKRPVPYTAQNNADGHAFVCDGYDGKGMYHINWGWNGNDDGYFSLSILNPYNTTSIGSNSSATGYNIAQSITIGVQPPVEGEKEVEVPEVIMRQFLDCAIANDSAIWQLNQNSFGNMTRKIRTGLGMVDNDGKITVVIQKDVPITVESAGVSQQWFAIKEISLPAGTHHLYPIARLEDIEGAEWQVMKPLKSHFVAESDGESMKLSTFLQPNLKIERAYYKNGGEPGTYDELVIVIKNNGEEVNKVFITHVKPIINGKIANLGVTSLNAAYLNAYSTDSISFYQKVADYGERWVLLQDSYYTTVYDSIRIMTGEPYVNNIELADYKISYIDMDKEGGEDSFVFEIKFYNNDERESLLGEFLLKLMDTPYSWTTFALIEPKDYLTWEVKEDFELYFEDYQKNYPTIRLQLIRRIISGYPQKILFDEEIPIGYTLTPAGLIKNGTTGIKGVVESVSADEKIYDLQGRHLSVSSASSVLPRGVYIKGGKKVIIK